MNQGFRTRPNRTHVRRVASTLIVCALFSVTGSSSVVAQPGIVITPDPPRNTSTPSGNLIPKIAASNPKDPREPIPKPLQQAKARQVIEHAFRDEYARQTSQEGRLKLALTLLDKGRLTDDDPTGRYCMLQDARSLGIELGEPTIVVDAIEELADSHRIPLPDELYASLNKLDISVRSSTGRAEIARFALKGMHDSIVRDDFLTARQFQRIADSSARRSQLRELNELVKRRTEEMALIQTEFNSISPAFRQLELKPDDPAANLQVGFYYAVSQNDWARGLPMLAKTSDNNLRRLAQLELSSPNDSSQQLELADGWWEWGTKLQEGSTQRKHVLRHAMQWYRSAHPRLQGLTEARVARMILDFQSLPERMSFEEQEEAGDIVYLSNLNPIKIDVTRNAFGTDGKRNSGEPLKLKGKWYEKALSTPPPARSSSLIVYELPETTFNYFRATVGIDDEVGNRLRTPLTFEVWGDYQRLWNSEPITRAGVVESCRVKILTVRRLELKVVCPGGDEFAWPVWGNPRLTMR